MRRAAVIAGKGLALLALGLPAAGCAGLTTSWRERTEKRGAVASPEALALSQEAQAAIDRHDDAAALGLLQRLVAVAPRSAEAYHRLGRVYQAQGATAQAEASYRRALQLDHEYVGAMIGMGTLEFSQGRPAEALTRFDAAIELDPHQSEAHLQRARALEALGRPEEALAAYFRTLEFNPNSAEATRRVAALQLAQGEPEQAHARLDVLVEQNPDDAEALFLRGRSHLVMNQWSQAVADLKAASQHMPERPDVFYQLALALEGARQRPEALQAAEQALKLAPGYSEARTLSERLRR